MVDEARPDIVLMDLGMPELDGVGATREIVEQRLARVVVLTTYADDGGEIWLDPIAQARFVTALNEGIPPKAPTQHPALPDKLTPRRSRGAGAHRSRTVEAGDRSTTLPRPGHRENAHQPCLRQDRPSRPRPSRAIRHRKRPRR